MGVIVVTGIPGVGKTTVMQKAAEAGIIVITLDTPPVDDSVSLVYIGTDNYEQEFALGLMDSERKLLREIDDALQHIEQRTYGICEGTGAKIPKTRLEAKPWARYCVEYARMLEHGPVTEGEKYEDNNESEQAS